MKSFKKKISSSVRKNSGSMFVEIGAGALVTISMMALALNACFAMLAYGINDRACRDAARAAAQQDTFASASNIARIVVSGFNRNASLMGAIQVDNVTYTDFGGNPPQDKSPFVTVTTHANVKMPAPIEFFGHDIFSGSLPVRKTYTFPIVRLNVNTQNG
ncbi:MAG: hypothetical protein K2X27_15465 [Candidatus Obscuribacterales bacterium]|nr:hypothetical protein [Candidatus Obscuribacterales bacterium]